VFSLNYCYYAKLGYIKTKYYNLFWFTIIKENENKIKKKGGYFLGASFPQPEPHLFLPTPLCLPSTLCIPENLTLAHARERERERE